MNNKPAIIISLFCILLLTSCTGDGTSIPRVDPYHTGTNGITMKFITGSPPKTVYPEDDFNILLSFENKGAYSVTKQHDESNNIITDDYGVLFLTYDPLYLEKIYTDPNKEALRLEGKNTYAPNGEGDIQEYGFHVKPLIGQREQPKTTLLFTLCYPYQTELSQEVCIDKDFNTQDVRKKVCTIKDISLSKGQGAPVTITKIQPRAFKRGTDTIIEFILTIENAGNGAVITRETGRDILDQCTTLKQESRAWNTLKVDANLLGRPLNCNGGLIILKDNKAEAKCTTEPIDDSIRNNAGTTIGSARNFISHITLTLTYLYQTSLSTDIEIQRIE